MRLVLILIGLYQAANGIAMLAAPDFWYVTVPGVTETGPINVHFIRDIGLAFLAAGAALLMTARLGISAALILPASVFLGGHALLHVAEMLAYGTSAFAALRDFVLIVIPGLLPLYALWHGNSGGQESVVKHA